MRKKVFLTGADGLLGHNLSRELSAGGTRLQPSLRKKHQEPSSRIFQALPSCGETFSTGKV
jgi:nucleoside-diphosphate-sugar epimerase